MDNGRTIVLNGFYKSQNEAIQVDASSALCCNMCHVVLPYLFHISEVKLMLFVLHVTIVNRPRLRYFASHAKFGSMKLAARYYTEVTPSSIEDMVILWIYFMECRVENIGRQD